MLFSLEYLPEAECTIETRYPLANGDAFKAVNAAVFYAIGRNNSGRRIEFEAVDGGTLYYVNSAGLVIQIFVLYVSECVALTRFHFIGVYVTPADNVLSRPSCVKKSRRHCSASCARLTVPSKVSCAWAQLSRI